MVMTNKEKKVVTIIIVPFLILGVIALIGIYIDDSSHPTDNIPTSTPRKFLLTTDYCSFDNLVESKYVTIEGYITLGDKLACENSHCGVWLYGNKEYSGKFLRLLIPIGTTPNHMKEPPNNYLLSDLNIFLDNGSLADYTKMFIITGYINLHEPDLSNSNYTCDMEDMVIQQ